MTKIVAQIQQNSDPKTENFNYDSTGEKPDIYYIILDSYAREDMLTELKKAKAILEDDNFKVSYAVPRCESRLDKREKTIILSKFKIIGSW